jgi:hypothetical protein
MFFLLFVILTYQSISIMTVQNYKYFSIPFHRKKSDKHNNMLYINAHFQNNNTIQSIKKNHPTFNKS